MPARCLAKSLDVLMAWPAQQPVTANIGLVPDIPADHTANRQCVAANAQIGMPAVWPWSGRGHTGRLRTGLVERIGQD